MPFRQPAESRKGRNSGAGEREQKEVRALAATFLTHRSSGRGYEPSVRSNAGRASGRGTREAEVAEGGLVRTKMPGAESTLEPGAKVKRFRRSAITG